MKRIFILVLCLLISSSTFIGCSSEDMNSSGLESIENEITQIEKVNKVLSDIDFLKEHNGYVRVQDGENSFVTFMYNKHGERVSQTEVTEESKGSIVSIHRNDNKSIIFGDKVYYGGDVDILTVLENSLNLVSEGKAIIDRTNFKESGRMTVDEILEQTASEINNSNIDSKEDKPSYKEDEYDPLNYGLTDDFYYYTLKIKGIENIRQAYKGLTEDDKNKVITNLKEGFNTDNLVLIYDVAVPKSTEEDDRTIGVNSFIEADGQRYMNWQFDGYHTLKDWKLKEEWYSDNWEDGEKAEALLENQLQELVKIIEEYTKEQGNLESGGE